MKTFVAPLVLILTFCLESQVFAQLVLVDNLSEMVRANTPIASPEFWAAQSFLSDDQLYFLNSIEALIGNSVDSPAVVAELRMADVSDEIDFSAGGLLTTFVIPSVSAGSPSIHEFVPLSNVNLLPNTRYWFLLGSANEGTYDWSYAQGGNFSGVGSIADYADSSDAGGTWDYHFGASPYDPYMIGVKATIASDSILVSNFAEPIRAATPVGNNPNPVDPPDGEGLPWYWGAQAFQSDGFSHLLTSIEAHVGDGSLSPLPIVVAELHADDSGTIGDLITTFTAPDVSGAISAQTFLPDSLVTLDPNTAYWFVLGSQAPGDGTYLMEYANSNLSVGPGTLGNFADSIDSGATWNYGDSSFPYFIQVNVAGTVTYSADFDHDGDVDGNDFLVWQRGDSPDQLSTTDLMLWQVQYGSPLLVANVDPVPEPVSTTLFFISVTMISAFLRHSQAERTQ